MSNIDIRKYVISNFKEESLEKLKDSIETTIKCQDEDALIGLGVIFEILWTNLSKENQDEYLNLILNKIKEN